VPPWRVEGLLYFTTLLLPERFHEYVPALQHTQNIFLLYFAIRLTDPEITFQPNSNLQTSPTLFSSEVINHILTTFRLVWVTHYSYDNEHRTLSGIEHTAKGQRPLK
jgi:hypothetical protein